MYDEIARSLESNMTTTEARHDALGEATLGELAQALRGELIRPQDPSYDEARSIWNGAHDKKPARHCPLPWRGRRAQGSRVRPK
jgi:hypothetical protein